MSAYETFADANDLRLVVEPADDNPCLLGRWSDADHYLCTLEREGGMYGRLAVPYSKSSSHHGEYPTLSEVLSCVSIDAEKVSGCKDADAWAFECGLTDEDEKANERIQVLYRDCSRRAAALQAMLGNDLYTELLAIN